jgi:hypothetical protein
MEASPAFALLVLFQALLAMTIVDFALFRIAQDLVGYGAMSTFLKSKETMCRTLRDFDKFPFSIWIVFCLVGMQLPRKRLEREIDH